MQITYICETNTYTFPCTDYNAMSANIEKVAQQLARDPNGPTDLDTVLMNLAPSVVVTSTGQVLKSQT